MSGLAFKAMRQAAAGQKPIADRVEMLVHRTPEELYDFAAAPDALHNLIADPASQEQIQQMRTALLQWMERTQGPLLPKFCATSGGQAKNNTEASKPGSPPPQEP